MRRLLHAYAGSRRPDETDDCGMAWVLGRVLGWEVRLHVLLQSDNHPAPIGRSIIAILLHGAYRDPRYTDAPAVRYYRKDRPLNLVLPQPRLYEDSLLILPWMSPNKIVRDSRKQAWLITVKRQA